MNTNHESVFSPLVGEGFTSLHISHNHKGGTFAFRASRDFEDDCDFSRYNKGFGINTILTQKNKCFGTDDVLALYERYGLTGYLNKVLDLMRQGRHIGLNLTVNNKLGIRHICGVHSDVRGRNNKSFTTFAGATRRHPLSVPEINVIIDALNLSRAMTFKNIAVDLPYGGCKTTLHMDEFAVTDMQKMGFLAYCCDKSHCITGPDMSMPKEMVKIMHQNFTMQYCGGPGSPLGDTAVPTALGTYLALKEVVLFQRGSASLDGLSIAVQGLGAVGYAMAELLLSEKVKLVVTDIKQENIDRLKEAYFGRDIKSVPPSEIIYADVDILCPCAMGGIIGDEEIPRIKAEYVFGAANNQIRATNQTEEIRLAKKLADAGIFFQTEWWHNGAGVLGAAMEYKHGRDITVTNDDLKRAVEMIMPAQTAKNLADAKEKGITPTEAAYARCEALVY
ncbi:MAG: amino acid dehydrogenase [Defluviitaleaceae bacterium]|nr:amino acid dehydrogenase [Defluviitaleaceae bacterium]